MTKKEFDAHFKKFEQLEKAVYEREERIRTKVGHWLAVAGVHFALLLSIIAVGNTEKYYWVVLAVGITLPIIIGKAWIVGRSGDKFLNDLSQTLGELSYMGTYLTFAILFCSINMAAGVCYLILAVVMLMIRSAYEKVKKEENSKESHTLEP